MKVTALLVIKCTTLGSSADTKVLANVSDVSQFGYFQRASAKEFILFIARTIASRTPVGQRQSVEENGKQLHQLHSYIDLAINF